MKIDLLIVAYMSPIAIVDGLVVYMETNCQCNAFGLVLKLRGL